MEYGWKCFNDESVTIKTKNCKLTVIAVYTVLVILLTLVVAAYSYATERL